LMRRPAVRNSRSRMARWFFCISLPASSTINTRSTLFATAITCTHTAVMARTTHGSNMSGSNRMAALLRTHLSASALAMRSTLDDSGQIQQLHLGAIQVHVARDAGKSCELVGCRRRVCSSELGQERRLADRGKADQRHSCISHAGHIEAFALRSTASTTWLQKLREEGGKDREVQGEKERHRHKGRLESHTTTATQAGVFLSRKPRLTCVRSLDRRAFKRIKCEFVALFFCVRAISASARQQASRRVTQHHVSHTWAHHTTHRYP